MSDNSASRRDSTDNRIYDGVRVIDNVAVRLVDIHTGVERLFSSHNISLNGEFSALSQWMAGVNNTGNNPVAPPTQIQLGSGSGTPAVTDTACFTPIAGTLTTMVAAQANTPSAGTTTFTFQIAAGVVTTEVTEAFLRNTSGLGFAHTMFGTAFTPTSTETINIQWTKSYGT